MCNPDGIPYASGALTYDHMFPGPKQLQCTPWGDFRLFHHFDGTSRLSLRLGYPKCITKHKTFPSMDAARPGSAIQ